MKAKKLAKKLVINKQTIANMNNEGMKKLKGGTTTTVAFDCPTGYTYSEVCFEDPGFFCC